MPAPAVESRELDANIVLFNRNDRRIFVLNETAAFVWQALRHGLSCKDVADEISQQTGIERARALADCHSLIDQWTEAGLATGGAEAEAEAGVDPEGEREPAAEAASTYTDEAEVAAWLAARSQADARRRYRIADLDLILEAPHEAFGLIDGLLDHIALQSRIRDRGQSSVDEDTPTLTIAKGDGGWVLFVEDLRFAGCDDDAKLAPMIHATVLHLSYAASESLVSIHGAAVFSGDRCVLLPGQPGAGKSTLTAALVNAGFGYCTDDFILLDGKPLQLRGVPLCIGLKEGSWPLLENSIPAVASLPTHLREDGQQVRYLPPAPQRMAASGQRFRASAIVFPRVAENEPCRLELLSRSAALLKIADAGYHLLGDLDVAAFDAMLAWLRSLDCYELTYSSLEDGVAVVSELLEPEDAGTGDSR